MNIEKPWIINIELTNACNLECCFCDHAVLKKKMAIKYMDDSLLKKVFSDIEEHEHDNKIYELGLVGLGEPPWTRILSATLSLLMRMLTCLKGYLLTPILSPSGKNTPTYCLLQELMHIPFP